jgi:hypothetical protein
MPWITLKVTAYVPGPKFAPYQSTAGLGSDALPVSLGNSDDIIVVPPGQPFEVMSESEATYLIGRHGGSIVSAPPIKDSPPLPKEL